MLGVWKREFSLWNPSLKITVLDRKNRQAFLKAVDSTVADVFICHWESLRLMPELARLHWFHVIADEVHRAKNRKAQQTTRLKKLPTMHKLGLTGTPADNRPDDIWSILNWLYPRTWTSYWRFYNNEIVAKRHTVGVCTAVGCGGMHKNAYNEVLGLVDPAGFQARIAPYFIRRLKIDPKVNLQLPEKYPPQRMEVELHPEQRRAYDAMRKNMLAWVGEHENEPIAAPIVVAQLVRLQQFAGAYARIEERKVRNKDGDWVMKPVLLLTEPSSKLDALMERIQDEDRQFVVFSKSRQIMEMFAARMVRHNISHVLFTGNTPQADRLTLVEGFQSGRKRIFAGTISAGGVGLTLTAASVVVFLDRHPSPGVNLQAEDRLHRIGQKNNIEIIDICARGTIDAQRLDQVEMKWKVIKELLGDA